MIDWIGIEPEKSSERSIRPKGKIDWSGIEPEEQLPKKQTKKGSGDYLKQATKLGLQVPIGLVQRAALPYDLLAIGAKFLQTRDPLTSTEQATIRQPQLAEDIKGQQTKNARDISGKLLNAFQDQRKYEKEAWSNAPEWMKKVHNAIRSSEWDSGSLLEKAFETAGIDVKPSNLGEHAVRFASFIQNPEKGLNYLIKSMDNPELLGSKVAQSIKSILPGPRDIVRGAAIAGALELAADNEFGPIGSLAIAAGADILTHGAMAVGPELTKFAKEPIKTTKEMVARGVVAASRLSGKEKLVIQQQLIEDFRSAGIQADLGSITGNNVIKAIQARLKASGLVGSALDDFAANLSKQITGEYKELAGELGEYVHQTEYEAGTALREGASKARDESKSIHDQLYASTRRAAASSEAVVGPHTLATNVENLERQLGPGGVKSSQQKAVLNALEDLKKDILDPEGRIKVARVDDLINSKRGLQDLIDYEVEGGAKQLLKNIVKEVDNTIQQYGRQNPQFAKEWRQANAAFAKHAKTYRSKLLQDILNDRVDPSQIMNRMNSVDGIRKIKAALGNSPEGRGLFNQLKRHRLEKMIGENMVDSTSQQIKLGTFSKLLEKGKNREVARELLGEESFNRLERLQKSSGRLAESAQKFFNSSKSASTGIDAGIVGSGVLTFMSALGGNPWPLVKLLGGLGSARAMAALMADPVFLRSVENGMLSGTRNDIGMMRNYYNYAFAPLVDEAFGGGKPPSGNVPKMTELPRQEMKEAANRQGMQKAAMKTEELPVVGSSESERKMENSVLHVNRPHKQFRPGLNEETKPHMVKDGKNFPISEYDIKSYGELLGEPKEIREFDKSRFIRRSENGEIINQDPLSKLSSDQIKLFRKEWNNHFEPELFDKFYNSLKENPYSDETIGTLRDFLSKEMRMHPRSKQIFKILEPVMDTPIKPRSLIHEAGPNAHYSPFDKTIVISTGLTPTGALDAIYHEAFHALQDKMGRSFNMSAYSPRKILPIEKFLNPDERDFLIYRQTPWEKGAHRFARRATEKIQKSNLEKERVKDFSRKKLTNL